MRAFESAARQLSFSQAARELNITHAVIAQQVRGLEGFLGKELVFREGRGLRLTANGAKLAQGLAKKFRAIGNSLNETGATDPGAPMRVSLTPAFAAQWLMPRLKSFWSAHPDVPISLHPKQRIIDLRRENIDLCIRFGNGVGRMARG